MTHRPTLPDDHFVRELSSAQQSLYAFVLSLVHDIDAAQDILQETNLVLWRKCQQGKRPQKFVGWAIEVARYQTLAWLRDRGRDRHLYDPKLLALLADESASRQAGLEDRRRMLHACIAALPPDQRDLLDLRYGQGLSNSAIAAAVNRSVTSVSQSLYRVRKMLCDCIARHAAGERA